MSFLRYFIARLVVGQFKQLTTSQKFLFYLRKAIYDGPWETLINDARYIINDVDKKVAEVCTFFTLSNYQSKLDLLQHRIKTAFSLCFANERQDLTRFFRINLLFADNFLSGCEMLEDVGSWDEINEDPDIKNLVFGIVGDLSGTDLSPHEIELIIKVLINNNK